MVAPRPSEQAGISANAGAIANNFNMRELFDDVAVAREHDPDVGPGTQRPGQRGGDGGKTADPDEVVHFRGDEQDLQETPSCRRFELASYARTGPVLVLTRMQRSGRPFATDEALIRSRRSALLGFGAP